MLNWRTVLNWPKHGLRNYIGFAESRYYLWNKGGQTVARNRKRVYLNTTRKYCQTVFWTRSGTKLTTVEHFGVSNTVSVERLLATKRYPTLPGFEPGVFWSVVRRVIRCATGPTCHFANVIEALSLNIARTVYRLVIYMCSPTRYTVWS